jgi:hypothetical protein
MNRDELPECVQEERALECMNKNWDKERCKTCENYLWCLDQVETFEASKEFVKKGTINEHQ